VSDTSEAPAPAQQEAEHNGEAAPRANTRPRSTGPRRGTSRTRRRLVVGGLLAVLVVAMLANTRFLTPAEVEALTSDDFDPATTAEELFAQAQNDLLADPAELGDVAAALADDPDAAVDEFDGLQPSEETSAFAVTATGVIEEADDENLTLDIEDVDTGQTITVPLGNALDGNLVRDLSGFGFGDAPGQTEHQQVGTEVSGLMLANVEEALGSDPEQAQGQQISVEGILSYAGTDADAASQRPLVIQPLDVGTDS